MKLRYSDKFIERENTNETVDISASDFFNLVYTIGSRILDKQEEKASFDSPIDADIE